MEIIGSGKQISYANDIINGLANMAVPNFTKTGDRNTDIATLSDIANIETERHHGRMLVALRDHGKDGMMAMRKSHPDYITPRTNAIRQCMTEYQMDSNGRRGEKDKLDASAIINTFGGIYSKLV